MKKRQETRIKSTEAWILIAEKDYTLKNDIELSKPLLLPYYKNQVDCKNKRRKLKV